jgi:hypothetical protein
MAVVITPRWGPPCVARPLKLRHIAELHRLDYPCEGGTFHYGQFAEHIH